MPDSVSQSSPASSSGMPTQIGRYIILRKLGQGGMGAVYEAEHSKLQKRVALKVLPHEVANDPAAVARFEREMLAVGRVTHPGIVQAHDADEADGIRYLAMEMVDGYDVADVAAFYEEKAGKPIPLSVACEIVRQAAVAMQAAHDAGLVHRDLKPSNLMLSVDGTVKVLDLGLAMLDAKHGEGGGLTSTGQVMGTVDYMAPEQAAETRSVDARADVYSLGATLYRLIAGKAPYPSDRFSSMLQKLMALANADPTPLKELRPKCPDKLAALVESAMAKDPAERTATAADLAAALESAGDAKKLAELAGKMPKREPIDPAALEATRASAREAAENVAVTGTMPGVTQPRMAVDPTVDTDNTAEATFIAQSIQADENVPTFVGIDAAPTVNADSSPARWTRKKRSALPMWGWGVGGAIVVVLIAVAMMSGPSNVPAPNADEPPEVGDVGGVESQPGDDFKLASGLRFDGKTSKVLLPKYDFDVTEPYTFEVIATPLAYPANVRNESETAYLVGKTESGLRLQPDGTWLFSLQPAEKGQAFYTRSHATAQLGNTYHIAGVYDGEDIRLFVDGQLQGAPVAASDPRDFEPWFLLGGIPPTGSRGKIVRAFEGIIHEARISNAAIYAGDFEQLSSLGTREDVIAHYRFDAGWGDGVRDLSGNGYDGRIVNAEWVEVAEAEGLAQPSSALRFDGDSWVEVSDVEIPQEFTAEAFVEWDGIGTPSAFRALNIFEAHERVWIAITDGDAGERVLAITAWHPREADKPGGGARAAKATSPAPIGERVHVALVRQGTELRLYESGNLVASTELPDWWFDEPYRIDGLKLGQRLVGEIGGFRYSSLARYSSTFSPPTELTADSDALVSFDFTGGSGDVVRDTSGNGHDGKIVGAEWISGDEAKSRASTSNIPTRSRDQIRTGLKFVNPRSCVELTSGPINFREPFAVEMLCCFAPEPVDGYRVLFYNGNFQLRVAPPIHSESARFEAIVDGLTEPKQAGWQETAKYDPTNASEMSHVLLQWTGRGYHLWLNGQRLTTESGSWGGAPIPGTTRFAELLGQQTSPKLSLGNAINAKDNPSPFSFRGSIWAATIYRGIVTDQDHFDVTGPPSTTARVVAAYTFDEGSGDVLHDISGNGHDGKIIGAEWVEAEPNPQFALAFDAADDYVDIGKSPIDLSKPFTTELWCRPTSISSIPNWSKFSTQTACDFGPFTLKLERDEDSKNARWAFTTTLPNDAADGETPSFGVSQTTNSTARAGELTHVAAQWTGDIFEVYVNGVRSDRAPVHWGKPTRGKEFFIDSLSRAASAPRLRLGSLERLKDGGFNGELLQFRLSQTARYSGSFKPSVELTADEQTAILYRFDEGYGDIVRDASGNGRDGKIVGAEWVGRIAGEPSVSGATQEFPGRLEFDGDDVVHVDSLEFDPAEPFTLEAAFSWKSVPDVTSYAVYAGRDEGPEGNQRGADAGARFGTFSHDHLSIRLGDVDVYGGSVPKTAERVHLALVHTGQELVAFRDGKLVGRKSTKGKDLGPGTGRFVLGRQMVGRYEVFRLSTTVRYDGDFTPLTRFTTDPHTLALYNFEDGTGDILHDASGNGHHGKIVGAKWVDSTKTLATGSTITSADGWVDLLAIADPEKDVASGEWSMLNNALSCQSNDHAMFTFPIKPVGNYELKATLLRPKSAAVALPIDDLFQTALVLDLYNESPRVSGLERVKLADANSALNLSRTSAWPSKTAPYELSIRVERVGADSVHITADLSGTQLVDWQGPMRDLTERETWAVIDKGRIGIGGWRAPLDVTQLSLRMLTGEAKLVPSLQTYRDSVASTTAPDQASSNERPDRSGLAFMTPNSHVNCGSIPIDFEKPFTIEMWCEPNELAGAEQQNGDRVGLGLGMFRLKIHGSDDYEDGYQYVFAAAEPSEKKFSGAIGKSAVVANRLVHLVGQWDGKDYALYVDGRLEGRMNSIWGSKNESQTAQDWIAKAVANDPDKRLCIGHYKSDRPDNAPKLNFRGVIRQVRVSQAARYADDFTPAPLNSDAATLAFYDFQDGSGDVLRDVSGNGNDGKITGAEWVTTASAPPLAVAPFDEAQAKAHQQAWAKYLGLSVAKEVVLPGGEKLAMMLIPPGEFLMGSRDEERARWTEVAKRTKSQFERIPHEGPQHRVRITQPFYLGKYEVTEAQWNSAMGINTPNFKNGPTHPAEQTRWENDDVQSFLTRLNASGSDDNLRFALPTEAQWEYACRAGTTTAFSLGDNEGDMSQFGWFNKNAGGKTHPVGQLRPNGFQLFDMHGNVWEWCADRYAADYYAASPVDDPTGPDAGSGRVVRGGSWWYSARGCRSAIRHDSTEFLGGGLGLRVVMTVPE